ncbi:GNAT family N-acetyltransferase [Deltaproteobacteria bacterium Smac51]|nr:GNAT family N-acetyltransferase [Deltaproteobacteria bacterium Smac51]
MSSRIRKARVNDVQAIYDLLKHMAAQGLLLPRSLSNLYEAVQSFFVAEDDEGKVIGVAALQVAWETLAEVRSLAVLPESGSRGLGRRLTMAVEDEARKLGITRMFSLTYVPGFFEKMGYTIVPLESLPQKIWAVCFQCVHYPDCKETAMVKDLD